MESKSKIEQWKKEVKEFPPISGAPTPPMLRAYAGVSSGLVEVISELIERVERLENEDWK